MAIVGLGAIGSQLAECLAKLGVSHFTLIDPDVVSEVNLGAQGFYEDEVGLAKVHAVADRIQRIRFQAHVDNWQKASKSCWSLQAISRPAISQDPKTADPPFIIFKLNPEQILK